MLNNKDKSTLLPIVFLFDQLTTFCLGFIKYSLVSLCEGAKINLRFLLFVIKEIEGISAVLVNLTKPECWEIMR